MQAHAQVQHLTRKRSSADSHMTTRWLVLALHHLGLLSSMQPKRSVPTAARARGVRAALCGLARCLRCGQVMLRDHVPRF